MEHFTIATVAERNPDFRRVLWTGKHTQLVVMTIPPGGEIGEEVHEVDQILTFVSGTGKAIVSGSERNVAQGDLVANPQDQVLVRALVQVCQAYGIHTVAEFVQDEPTLRLLRELGVDYVQGYLIGRPAPVSSDQLPAT